MAARVGTHPSPDDLRGFAVGKLDDVTAAEIMNHLDSCPDCCRAAAAQSGDDFLGRLRQAHSLGGTPAPAESLTGSESASKLTVRPIANLPPELANNPQYEVLRELGRGGMGVVYLARNRLMDRLEVLKVVNKALVDRPGAVERFRREIRSAAMLHHANVVGAYSAVQSGDLLAFAMEYVEGEDLARLVQTQGPLPVVDACDYVQQAAVGLQHAFEKQMVHRDIKPHNLIRAARRHEAHRQGIGLRPGQGDAREQRCHGPHRRPDHAGYAGLRGPGADVGRRQCRHPRRRLQPRVYALLPVDGRTAV